MNERELYQQKAEAKLSEWKAELDKLKAQARQADADTRIELNRQIEAMDAQIEQGESRIRELSEASEQGWQELKQGFETAWGNLSDAFDRAVDRFRHHR
ncbi:coiled coil domain-containing protein [Oceanimonas sp. MB9]|uniref:coiled coil domain-containing protein n=1 Tax=Oceanimonas sp. MB9 TaxID=2588453 RepID=UPI0013F66F65|nr:coiled coil domain-containing protein [Oceanimonas sp. MB9]NHI02017.1 hypothetical protein [Oceanimonas sp. MB9]